MIFLVCAHTDAPMLQRMCKALDPFKVLIHVDARSDIGPFRTALATSPNATLLPHRVAVHWAGFSQVQAALLLLQEAVKQAHPHEHLLLLSGQDYPIRPMHELQKFLLKNPQTQFVRSFDLLGSGEWKYEQQVLRRHHRDFSRFDRTILRHKRARNAVIRVLDTLDPRSAPDKPADLKVAHGETHWALTAECASSVLQRVNSEVIDYFRSAFAPDEKFFHSLVASSGWCDRDSGYGLVPYEGAGNWRYTNFHLLNEDHSTRSIGDWNVIDQSDRYFVRKVQTGISDSLLDRIDQRRLGTAPS